MNCWVHWAHGKRLTVDGVIYSRKEAAKEFDLSASTVANIIHSRKTNRLKSEWMKKKKMGGPSQSDSVPLERQRKLDSIKGPTKQELELWGN